MAGNTHERTLWTMAAVNAAVVMGSMLWVGFDDSAAPTVTQTAQATAPTPPPTLPINFSPAATPGDGPVRG
ncbi:MAG TPA: hypothetical protein VGN97_09805 [Mesorhizobium sp.]|nr:hypothetical protein [Mesorhizobium sp.]